MADLKDFGTVKSWYDAYKKVLDEAEDKKKKSPVEVLPKENSEEEKQPEEKSESEEVEKLKAEIERLKGEVQKKDLEVKKKDAEVNVEPNAETGEVPLRVGIAQSILDKKKKKEVKEELEEATVAVYDVSYDDMPKNKLAQFAKQLRIRMKNLPRNKVAFGGDAAIEFSGSDSDLLKFFKQHFGSSARNIRDLKKELGEETLDEKLKVSDGLGAWISDFQKSDAPQFKGKSDKERRDMAIAAFTDAGGKLESVDEAKNLNDLKKMLDNTTLLTPKEKKDIQSLEKKMGAKAYTKVLNKMFSEETEQLEEANAVEYARKLASYAVKKGGIDKKDFMKIADRMSNAKNDNDMKKIGDMIDSLDTEPRDLVQGSIALLMGPKTYLKMFGDRLTSRDMNQYKKMTPRDMKEETLDEVNVNAKGTVPSKQIASLKRAYNSLPDRIDPEKAMALAKMLDRFGEGELRQLTHAGIKFISTLAINKLIMKHKYKAKDIHDIRKNKPKTVFD